MKHLLKVICAVLLISSSTSCSSESDVSSIVGSWKLTAWNASKGLDLNNDGIVSTNILDEIDCISNETLVFESNGVVSSNATFNPDLDIVLLNGTSDEYIFNVTCDKDGMVSYATTYSQNGDSVLINESEATIRDNKLSRIFEDAIKIYNEDHTELVDTIDVTYVYTKQ